MYFLSKSIATICNIKTNFYTFYFSKNMCTRSLQIPFKHFFLDKDQICITVIQNILVCNFSSLRFLLFKKHISKSLQLGKI